MMLHYVQQFSIKVNGGLFLHLKYFSLRGTFAKYLKSARNFAKS